MVTGRVGEGLAGAGVEDVLDEVRAAADHDDGVGDGVGELDVVVRQLVVGTSLPDAPRGEPGQALDRAEVDDRDGRPGVALVADLEPELAATERRPRCGASRRTAWRLAASVGIEMRPPSTPSPDGGDDDAGVAHPAEDAVPAADEADGLVELGERIGELRVARGTCRPTP